MAKNVNLSDLDAAQVFKRVVDADHDSIRVVQAHNTETIIEINAEDGDSVQSVPRTRLITEADGHVACSDLREICVYADDSYSCTVEISPDGVKFFTLQVGTLKPIKICAVSIRVSNCVVVGRS